MSVYQASSTNNENKLLQTQQQGTISNRTREIKQMRTETLKQEKRKWNRNVRDWQQHSTGLKHTRIHPSIPHVLLFLSLLDIFHVLW
jgi:hypothetical protein